MCKEIERLVQEASAGDELAFRELLEQNLPMLRTFVRAQLGGHLLVHESADDLVQSVCREVLQDLGEFEYRSDASFRKWLCLSAVRKIRDRDKFYKRQRRDPAREEGSAGYQEHLSMLTPSRILSAREEIERLDRAMDTLSDEQRTVLCLSRLIGLSHAEIAEEIGKSVGATRVVLHRALARLGRALGEACDPPG